MTTITIDPVTRIEGHARVIFDTDPTGQVLDARLIVNELRGFERLLVGMEADRMPLITARICGVCPSAHHLAAIHALDTLASEPPPQAAKLLRELLYMGHLIHSHTLSLFVLQGPDLLLGINSPIETRNVVGVVAENPELAKQALRLRSLGQKINELIGGRGIHPVTAVAGGISFDLDQERFAKLTEWAKEALALAVRLVPTARDALQRLVDNNPNLALNWQVPTYQLATQHDAGLAFCEGDLCIFDPRGVIADKFPVEEYQTHFVEVARTDCYLKPVYAKLSGAEQICRTGPLARINCVSQIATPHANRELARFRAAYERPCHFTAMQTWARAIELLYATERAVEIIEDPRIRGVSRVPVTMNAGRAIGHVEAPRGTLIHDYQVDERGFVTSANLLVATQYNYAAINTSLRQAVGDTLASAPDAELLASVEFAIRCYDPCLSCATHQAGKMPLDILVMQDGRALRSIRRPQ
jgi:F420-non-reducing hydrogenase large subunit